MLHVSRHYKLGHLINIAYENSFLANTYSIRDMATFPLLLQHLFSHNTGSSLLLTNSFLETVLSIGIRVYGDLATVK